MVTVYIFDEIIMNQASIKIINYLVFADNILLILI